MMCKITNLKKVLFAFIVVVVLFRCTPLVSAQTDVLLFILSPQRCLVSPHSLTPGLILYAKQDGPAIYRLTVRM